MKILKREMYDFFGAYDEKRVKKPLSQWKFFSCHRHFGAVLSILIFVKFNFLNRFFVLNAFWIPNNHPLNFFKLF